MRQEVTLLGASFGTEAAFIEPEILQIGREKLQQFLSSEPRLASYRFYIEEIFRQRGAYPERARGADSRQRWRRSPPRRRRRRVCC